MFPFGSEGKHHDSGISKTVGLKMESTFGSIYIGVSDTTSGPVPQSLESLNDLAGKMKVKNIQATHEFPRKPTILYYREDNKMKCLNGTRLTVLTMEYWVKYRESRLYKCGGLHLNLFIVKTPLDK